MSSMNAALIAWATACSAAPELAGTPHTALAQVVLVSPAPVVYGFWYDADGKAHVWEMPDGGATYLQAALAVRDAATSPWDGCVLRLPLPHLSVDATWLYGEQVADWDVQATETMTRAAAANPRPRARAAAPRPAEPGAEPSGADRKRARPRRR